MVQGFRSKGSLTRYQKVSFFQELSCFANMEFESFVNVEAVTDARNLSFHTCTNQTASVALTTC